MIGEEKARINWSLALFFLTVALMLINFVSLWLRTRELSVGTEIIYWQKFNSYFSGVWYLSFLLLPITLGIWAKIGIRKFRSAMVWFLLSVASLFVCAFADYSALFILKFIEHIGTIKLNSNVYHFASVTNYDRGTTYYLGKCDDSGYKCIFHAVYNKSDEGYYIPTSIEITQNNIQLMRNGEVVYEFDGIVDRCFLVERYYGDCLINNP
jgi:hypothetical protein